MHCSSMKLIWNESWGLQLSINIIFITYTHPWVHWPEKYCPIGFIYFLENPVALQCSNVTLLNNREGTKKNCLGLSLVPSESSHFLVSEMLYFKILVFWSFEKNNFDFFLFSRSQLQNPTEMKLCWNFPLEDRFFEKLKKWLDPFL